jgi:hypothetical protein
MSHVEHDIVCSAMLDKCLQLVLDVLGLLSRQPRDRVLAVKSLWSAARAFDIGQLLRSRGAYAQTSISEIRRIATIIDPTSMPRLLFGDRIMAVLLSPLKRASRENGKCKI